MTNPWDIYDYLIDQLNDKVHLQEVLLGGTWTLCNSINGFGETSPGLAMSPAVQTRVLPWSGTLTGKGVKDVASWIKSWNPYEASVAMAAINSVINSSTRLLQTATQIIPGGAGNLAIFDYFFPRLQNKKIVVIGNYPGLQQYTEFLDLTILERNPTQKDLPDQACEYLLPEADWVFITGSSLVNKTFPRLAELSKNAVTVLMGPTVPWVEEFVEYGIDFLAGVQVADYVQLQRIIAEGGGTRIFENAVQYCVADLSQKEMHWLKNGIADLVARREILKHEMQHWYNGTRKGRFPKWRELERLELDLSRMDSQFKRQWDARFA